MINIIFITAKIYNWRFQFNLLYLIFSERCKRSPKYPYEVIANENASLELEQNAFPTFSFTKELIFITSTFRRSPSMIWSAAVTGHLVPWCANAIASELPIFQLVFKNSPWIRYTTFYLNTLFYIPLSVLLTRRNHSNSYFSFS